MSDVRVRFAPSPTGGLHIGGVRTALFNYLFAKRNKGVFILRIEDTDQARFVEGAEEYITQALSWCGIVPDESPQKGGPHMPYRQSERKDIYLEYAQQLINEGNAYYAFDSSDELEKMRERLKEEGVTHLHYNSASRMTMNNSLTLSPDTVTKKIEAGEPYVIRLKIPEKEDVQLNDLIRGQVNVNSSTLDDKVILKSDGLPTYHLANVVDDHLMEITHVIRGEEWLPSAPMHVLLYQAFGWEDSMPQFAHLPLILKPDGNGKLSKRAADQAGFPIFPLNWIDPQSGETTTGFKEEGYLPDALVNFLALLGWNPGDEQELFTLTQLMNAFSLERVGKAGTKFDIDKVRWFNQQYLINMSNEELAPLIVERLSGKYGIICSTSLAIEIAGLQKQRATFPNELADNSLFLFKDPIDFDQKTVDKKWNLEAKKGLEAFATNISARNAITDEDAKELLHQSCEAIDINPGKVMQMLRLVITGSSSGPDLMKIVELLGGDSVSKRILSSIEALPRLN